MTVRSVAPADIEQLYGLFAEHAVYEDLPFDGAAKKDALGELLFCTPPRIYGWVVEANDELLGYMTATIDYSTWNAAPFVYMDCLYVREQHRGNGLGQKLMEQLTAFAREKGCNEIQWHTPPANDLGIGFYNRIGATSLAKVRFFLDPQNWKGTA